jgi:hypothetical protein
LEIKFYVLGKTIVDESTLIVKKYSGRVWNGFGSRYGIAVVSL